MRVKMDDQHLPAFLYKNHEQFKPPGPGKYETVELFSPKKNSLSTY